MKLILASQSPRRRELLRAAGYEFEVCPPSDEAEDGHQTGETPEELVVRLSRQKAADVARRTAEGLVLGCDTVVECGGRIFGKPDDAADARAILTALSGREHHVISGLCLWPVLKQGATAGLSGSVFPMTRTAVTTLRMDLLTPEQLDAYIAGGEWSGKAGAFGYQDGLDWVHILSGSESNVVGLPLELLAEMLATASGGR